MSKSDVLRQQGSRRNPAQRFRWESKEKVRPAHEKSPKAFFIALGLFLSLERATRLELASRHPTNTGDPAETQGNGFGGERTNSEMSEGLAADKPERYGVCEDDGDSREPCLTSD